MKLYNTVYREGSAEQTIEKSRFIAYVKPVSDREEAEAFIAAIRKKHKDATHNVPAMVIGDKFQIQWASDDGEPQGTSGAPMVQMLVKEGITNVVIVVTRYFGGIKLGTGGLVRAYTNSAKLGLAAAGICSVEERCVMTYAVDYTYLTKIQNMAQTMMHGGASGSGPSGSASSGGSTAPNGGWSSMGATAGNAQAGSKNEGGDGFTIEDLQYTDVVTLTLSCRPESAEGVLGMLSNVTSGKGLLLGQEVRQTKCQL